MKRKPFSIISICLVFCLLFTTACGKDNNTPVADSTPDSVFDDPFAPERTEISFSDIPTRRYNDIDAFRSNASSLKDLSASENALEQLKEKYNYLYNELMKIQTYFIVSRIRYDIDIRSEALSEEFEYARSIYNEAYMLMQGSVAAVLSSPYKDDFTKVIGEDAAKLHSSQKILTKDEEARLTALYARESQYINDYYELLGKKYTAVYKGKAYTIDDINNPSLTSEAVNTILTSVQQQANNEMCPIYIELVKVRKEIAAIYGYESAAEYYYQSSYNRDYSPTDAQQLHAYIKQYLVPVYTKIQEVPLPKPPTHSIDTENLLPFAINYVNDISSDYGAILTSMSQRDMVFIATDKNKSADLAYTTVFNQYNQPFLYYRASGSWQDVTAMAHEIGHYLDMYLNGYAGAFTPTNNYDMSEVLSTGMEILFLEYYDSLLGNNSKNAKITTLSNFMETVLSGSMYDEAQQQIYAYKGELTTDIVNSIFAQTAKEYGYKQYSYMGLSWVNVFHNFEVPFYYLSYATSALTSLELYTIAQNNGFTAAREKYMSLMSCGSFDYGYADAISACNLKGFNSEENIKGIAQLLYSQITGSDN